jgi:hypothetical protein
LPKTKPIDISVLLPTRGRCLLTLADHADDISRVEMLLAFDHDDESSIDYFNQRVAPELDERGAAYEVFGFDRLGYIRLNEYLNQLAAHSRGRWLFFWGDDAIMESDGWDSRIAEVTTFRVLRIPTHNCHPYAIWPIVPRVWYEMFGYISAHQLTDSWCSQIGYMTDIIQNIDVQATHDRFDLTGNNRDETYDNRPMLEGRPDHPLDFNHVNWRRQRMDDAVKITEYRRGLGEDVSWFDNVLARKQNPWEKMLSKEYDPNGQVSQINYKKT